MRNLVVFALVLAGTFFNVIAAIGIVKMPDIFMRMHAATKSGTLGSGLILIGAASYFASGQVIIEAVLTILFIYITAPIASHLIARAAYVKYVRPCKRTVVDEMRPYF